MVAAVERRRNEARTEALVRTYGGPVDAPADEVMADLIATAYGHVTWLAAAIAQAASLGDVDRFLIERYDAERILLARMTKDALGVGIAERQVKLAEDQGRRISALMRDILADVFAALAQAAADESLTVDVLVRIQREAVPAVVRQRLSEVMELGA